MEKSFLKCKNSLSEVDPVIQSGQHIIRICEMKIFSCENLWLSDEIMERAYQKFLEIKTEGLFFSTILSSPK